eukprot:CAMPEP_0196665390 /NCGR_PEP_ID=MMETSP1086-20130531/60843_1 /TAXON_ID=77921 /ORGANISM="Cyanoptyche  gloeocystis , Strain SAG4.97" /LENGTH=139 /DNA_ID=CAMNT_0042002133 /DNA_START=773 /DNA_END=1188 /DNA_ORIENTATION=+
MHSRWRAVAAKSTEGGLNAAAASLRECRVRPTPKPTDRCLTHRAHHWVSCVAHAHPCVPELPPLRRCNDTLLPPARGHPATPHTHNVYVRAGRDRFAANAASALQSLLTTTRLQHRAVSCTTRTLAACADSDPVSAGGP